MATQQAALAKPEVVERGRRSTLGVLRESVVVRLFLTVWLVFAVHASTNVVRETYLAVTLGDRFSIRVDEYMGLHPDLFEIEGRGAFINNNPGASMLGALPYVAARPFMAALFAAKPHLIQPKPPARYDDPRPNRTRFMNEARERGVDVKLGLAALVTQLGLMAPLGAAAAVGVFLFLRASLHNQRHAFWLALLYAFGTPVFFRSAFLNQNLILAHAILAVYLLIAWPVQRPQANQLERWRLIAVGLLLGFGLVTEYSAIPLILVFVAWLMIRGWQSAGGWRGSMRVAGWIAAGATPPALILFAYQWAAFGNPLLPAQAYMPATENSVHGWHGFVLPMPELLWRNLFDLRYGLLVFCPMLILAVAAPFVAGRAGRPTRDQLTLIFAATLALWLFNSMVRFALLQFNTGVRYMVPAVPLLFFAMVPVLLRLPRAWRAVIVALTVLISWSVSMARESVPESLARIIQHGPELPVITVLQKMSSGYNAPFLQSAAAPSAILALTAAAIWLLWRRQRLTP